MLGRLKRLFKKEPEPEEPESDKEIIRILAEEGDPLWTGEIHERLGGDDEISRRNIQMRLKTLNDRGFVSEIERGKYRLSLIPREPPEWLPDMILAFFTLVLGVPLTESVVPAFISAGIGANYLIRWKLFKG